MDSVACRPRSSGVEPTAVLALFHVTGRAQSVHAGPVTTHCLMVGSHVPPVTSWHSVDDVQNGFYVYTVAQRSTAHANGMTVVRGLSAVAHGDIKDAARHSAQRRGDRGDAESQRQKHNHRTLPHCLSHAHVCVGTRVHRVRQELARG